MRIAEIEQWIYTVIERAKSGQPVEDSRVELKSAYVSAKKAARRVAGHANAAGGEPILWVIGVDEKAGTIVGVEPLEMADWLAQMKSEFDEVAPSVTHVSVSVEGKIVVGLLFETDRLPYVVKSVKGASPDFEVPWREGTMVRTARRADLIRLLVPLQRLPMVEVLDADLSVSLETHNGRAANRWQVGLMMYFHLHDERRMVIPFHQCAGRFESTAYRGDFDEISFRPHSSKKDTISSDDCSLFIDRPGPALADLISWMDQEPIPPEVFEGDVTVTLSLGFVGLDRRQVFSCVLSPIVSDRQCRWRLQNPKVSMDPMRTYVY